MIRKGIEPLDSRIAREYPEIKNMFRAGTSTPAIAEQLNAKLPELKIRRQTVRRALRRLIPDSDFERLADEHQRTGGIESAVKIFGRFTWDTVDVVRLKELCADAKLRYKDGQSHHVGEPNYAEIARILAEESKIPRSRQAVADKPRRILRGH